MKNQFAWLLVAAILMAGCASQAQSPYLPEAKFTPNKACEGQGFSVLKKGESIVSQNGYAFRYEQIFCQECVEQSTYVPNKFQGKAASCKETDICICQSSSCENASDRGILFRLFTPNMENTAYVSEHLQFSYLDDFGIRINLSVCGLSSPDAIYAKIEETPRSDLKISVTSSAPYHGCVAKNGSLENGFNFLNLDQKIHSGGLGVRMDYIVFVNETPGLHAVRFEVVDSKSRHIGFLNVTGETKTSILSSDNRSYLLSTCRIAWGSSMNMWWVQVKLEELGGNSTSN